MNGRRCCKVCLEWLESDEFYNNSNGKPRPVCKECYNLARNKTGKKSPRRPIVNGKRQCGGCGLWLDATPDNFHIKAYGEGLHTYCKSCRSKINKNYLHRRKMGWTDNA